jgi:hydrogenase maturation protein HypF
LLDQAGVYWRDWELHRLLGNEKAALLEKLGKTAVRTSSLGRVLDALSCYLGIGTERTYDGEPAMRLERHIAVGEPHHEFEHGEPKHDGNRGARVVEVAPLFRQLHEKVKRAGRPDDAASRRRTADLVRSFVECVVFQMVDIAVDRAHMEGIGKIGLTGGVSYNIPICEIAVRRIRERGLEPLLHDRIPNGDGGISAGQNALAGMNG